MLNCCMRRPAKFHVDSAVRFWAIANIREGGGVKRPPPGQARVNPRPDTVFRRFRPAGRGLVRPPWRFQTKRRRASRKRPADCSPRVFVIGGIIFGPRSIFDLVMIDQRSNFREFHDFSTSRVHSSKTIYRSGMRPLPACPPFNSA